MQYRMMKNMKKIKSPTRPRSKLTWGCCGRPLRAHVDAKAKIEEDIPAEAITAGVVRVERLRAAYGTR